MDYPVNQLEFEKRFATDDACKDYLFKLRFPNGFICPLCSNPGFWKQSRDRVTCNRCLHEFSPLSGTLFHKSHLPLTLWFRATWWITNQKQGVNALGLQRALGLGSYRTSWMLLQKLRGAMVRPNRDLLRGDVEVDEIWLGGMGTIKEVYNKRLILTCVEKNGDRIGRIRMKLIPNTSGETLLSGIQECVEPGSTVETNGWQGYLLITNHGYKHQRKITPDSRKDIREQNILPKVHRVASLFKRWVLGTYQGRIDTKHLPVYLDEFVFRFNRRTSKSRGLLFYRLLENAVQTKSRPYQAIAGLRSKPCLDR
ncbi:MAG: IS1595 family transposase [Deltaproteobacteria bacterium]|nr:IS1595 family transposase [Deltaproteobacteria bacterium]